MELNIAHVLRTIAAQQPESDCLCSERRQLSWAEFDDRTDRFAGALLGAGLLVVANLFYASSIVVYDAILVEVAEPDERDRVSSQGWAFGYLGGGLLLAVNLAIVTIKPFGLSTEMAVRVSLLSAAIWWAYFTFIPYRGIKDRPPRGVAPEEGVTLMQRSFGQLFRTLKELKNYPQTLLFLVAYLFYNDGIQTVIYSASVYGDKQLGFGPSVLIATILIGTAAWLTLEAAAPERREASPGAAAREPDAAAAECRHHRG